MNVPTSSYRIQFNPRFTFKHLGDIMDYLEELGIAAIYASPILRPTKGSEHGYDGIDPSQLNPELGTIEELETLTGLLRNKGITWIQDIVPNHLAYDTTNVWLKDVFERGIDSTYSSYFDIDWDHPFYQKKLMTPFLEAPLSICVDENKVSLVFNAEGFFIAYYNSLYPVNIETYPSILSGCIEEGSGHVNAAISALINNHHAEPVHWQRMKSDLLGQLQEPIVQKRISSKLVSLNEDRESLLRIINAQFYVLCHHMDSNIQVNYRRFFNVNGLICLRIEDQRVFDAYHQLSFELYKKGIIQGLRIDHIDGLKNPREYIDRLRKLFGEDCYIIVEKILDAKEQLPAKLDIQGTSGYEFLSYINQLLTDNRGAEELLKLYFSYVPEFQDYEGLVFEKKLINLQHYLNGEWDNLLRLLLSLNLIDDEEIRLKELKMALGVFMAAYPVYRAYIDGFPLEDNDKRLLSLAFEKSLAKYPALHYELGVLKELFEPHPDATRNSNRLLFIQRLMQFTGPLAAKGVEDTVFFLYNPLISHNEVGDQPCVLGITVDHFHEKMKERARVNACSFNCTSTHDTKRGEDARIRINIISEMGNEWKKLVAEWQALNEPFRTKIGVIKAPIVNDEYFLYQAITGGFPEDLIVTDTFKERTKRYFTKVLRETKMMSNYIEPNFAYENACHEFIDHLLNPKHGFLPSLMPFVKKIIRYASVYTMVQVIIKTTAPGIPDIYQGCELWDLSYVDPDNRRPVDYTLRKKLLGQIKWKQQDGGVDEVLKWAAQEYETGAQKIYITQKILQLRKQKKDVFSQGEYIPISLESGDREAIAYLRRFKDDWALIVLPMGIVNTPVEKLPALKLPVDAPKKWKNIFTEETFNNHTIPVAELWKKFPVSVFVNEL